ncbi:MAG: hypothetical protein U0836_20485 [Pirellulales bacterium]
MVQLAACPACRQWVALRGAWADDEPLRCPHCQAEYTAGQARKHAVPELIPLNPAAAAAEAADSAPSESAAEGAWPALGPSASPAPASGGTSAWPKLDSKSRPASLPKIGLRPRRKPANPVAELVKIVAGGAAGLAVGYVILLWMGGPKNDFLEILPKLPEWLKPAAARQGFIEREPAESPVATSDPPADAAFPPREVDLSSADPEPAPRTSSPSGGAPSGLVPSTAAEVRQALAAADAALEPAPVEASAKGPTPEQRAALAATAWDRLIDVSTRLAPSDPDSAAARAAVEKAVYRRLNAADAADAWNRRAQSQLSDRSDRDQSLALVGRLQQVERRGAWYLTHLVLAGQPKLAALVSAEPLEFKPGDDLAVLGLTLAQPRERFAGYEGPAQGPVVWPGVVVRVAARPANGP